MTEAEHIRALSAIAVRKAAMANGVRRSFKF